MCKFIKHIEVHDSWKAFVDDEIKAELIRIENSISEAAYTPEDKLVLRFLSIDINKIKVIVIGQDPYPSKGVATGRAFEMNFNGLSTVNWDNSKIKSSLKNIVKLVHKSYCDNETVDTIKNVRHDIKQGKFPIKPPNKIFDYWESNGVLFLNSAFTCEINNIGSHLILWDNFFRKLLAYINVKNKEIKYFLWGESRKYKMYLRCKGVLEDNIYESGHPTDRKKDDGEYKLNSGFYMNNCFKDTMEDIKWVK